MTVIEGGGGIFSFTFLVIEFFEPFPQHVVSFGPLLPHFAYRFPRVFGDEFGEKFGEKFSDSLNLVKNVVTILVMNLVNHHILCQIQ